MPNPNRPSNQVNREQKHADVFGDFHGLTLLDRYLADNPNRVRAVPAGNTDLRSPSGLLSAFLLHESGVQLRWAHRPGGLCSTSYLADFEIGRCLVRVET